MRRLLLLLAGLIVLSACGSQSFVSQQYGDFTAYYNTFYNAQNAFEDGMEALEASDRPVDPEQYTTIFRTPGNAPGEQHFEEAIRWSADILREHPDSRWVDDALMIIGKSDFYLDNQASAAEKFREVIALSEGSEEEAHFWLVRTLLAARDADGAIEHAEEVAGEDLDEEWMSLIQLARGEAHVQQEQWDRAVVALERGLENPSRSDAAARGAFLLGQVHETLDQPEEAARAYARVTDYRPTYDLGYAARVGEARMQSRAGRTEEALATIRDMEGSSEFRDDRLDLKRLRAQLERDAGRYDAAHRTFRELLYADESPSGDVEARAHYQWGTLYEEVEGDYVSAAAHYDTAATRLGRSSSQEARYTPFALTDVQERAERFNLLADRSVAVTRLDSLLELGALEEDEFQSFIAELEEQRAEQEADRSQQEDDAFDAGGGGVPMGADPRAEAADGEDFAASAAGTADEGAGFLFHRDQTQVQEMQQRFERRWGDRPRVPNWRRIEAVVDYGESADDEEVAEEIAEAVQQEEQAAEQGEVEIEGSRVDVSEVPRDEESRAAMKEERAVARYELGTALFLVAEEPDSARVWFERVLEEDRDRPVARRALYALAEAHTALGDTTEAQRTYERVIDRYPDSNFAERARSRLGQGTSDEGDSSQQADAAYAEAYDRWQQGDHHTAYNRMIEVALQYNETPVAPRALLAAASIGLEQRNAEGARPLLDPSTSNMLAQRDDDSTLALIGADIEGQTSIIMLLDYLADRYPESPQADRAERMLYALDDDREPEEEATDTPEAIAAGASPEEASHDEEADPSSDETEEQEEERGEAETLPGPTTQDDAADDAEGSAPAIDRAAGGWAIAVASETDRSAVDEALATYRDAFGGETMPVDLLPAADAEEGYQIVVGQYPGEDRAALAIQNRSDELPEEAEPVPITPPAEAPHQEASEEATWSIVVASHPDEAGLEGTIEQYQALIEYQLEEDWTVTTAHGTVEGRERHRVLIGAFNDREAAAEARDRHASDLPDNAWVIRADDR